jgi:TonB family protein
MMNLRKVFLFILLLIPGFVAFGQEQKEHAEEQEAIPMTYVKALPRFDGGDANAFSKWVNEHKIYPEEAKKAGIQGRVTLQFTITKEGKLTDVKLLRGVHPLLDEEAIRVVKSAPQKWTPGKRKGEFVDVTYTFPVVFQLSQDNNIMSSPETGLP